METKRQPTAPTRITRWVRIIWLSLTILLAITYGVTRWYKLNHYSTWLKSVSISDNEAAVRKKMGSPDVVQRHPEPLWCNTPECEFEFLYGHSIPPKWWLVGFDKQGRVIETTELNSP